MSLRGPSPGGRAVAVAICLAVTGATPVVDGVDRVVPDSAALSLAVEARQRLRDFRDAHGLPELGEAAELDLLAYQHASELASSGRVSHYSEIHGLTTATRVRLAYPYVRTLAENVARGGTIERIHVKLLNSPGHRANRLDPRFTHVGIGVARRGEHMLYLAEVYIAVPGGGDPGPVPRSTPTDRQVHSSVKRPPAERSSPSRFASGRPAMTIPSTGPASASRRSRGGTSRAPLPTSGTRLLSTRSMTIRDSTSRELCCVRDWSRRRQRSSPLTSRGSRATSRPWGGWPPHSF